MNLKNRKVPGVGELSVLDFLNKTGNLHDMHTIEKGTRWKVHPSRPTDYCVHLLVEAGLISENEKEALYKITEKGKKILQASKIANQALLEVEKMYEGSA